MDEADVLERLVRAHSPSGREGAAVREFGRIATDLGYRVGIDPAGNGVARRGTGRPRLVFLGHIDTVPGGGRARRHRGRIFGRGSVDAKGALASALVAGREFEGPGTLEVIAGVGEETDSRGARHLVRRRGVDAVIAGEPNRWDGIGVGYKGCLRVEATFRRAPRHLSSPFLTSADHAVSWASSLSPAPGSPGNISPFRSLSAKVVRADTEVGTRDATTLVIDLRLPPGRTCRSVLSELPRPRGGPRLHVTTSIEPWETPAGTPVVSALIAAIRAEGARPTLWRKAGTSDVNLVAPAWGCPAAVYGPGNSHLDHTARESVSEAELRRAVRVLRRTFSTLATRLGGDGGSVRARPRP